MKERNITKLWAVSLLILGVCTMLIGLTGMTELQHKNTLMWSLGVAGMAALAALIYASVMRIKKDK